MIDYEKELLADLLSSDEEEQPVESTENPPEDVIDQSLPLSQKLSNLITSLNNPFQTILQHPNIESITDYSRLSKIYPLISELNLKFEQQSNDEEIDYLELIAQINNDQSFESEEYKFILLINELSTLINNEILAFTILLKMQYKLVFPELEHILLNNIDYVRTIMLIKQDLVNIKQYDKDLQLIMTKDKVLILVMAALQQSKNQFTLSESDFSKIMSLCLLILDLNDLLTKLSNFISSKLSKFAPNVSSIIGPITTSQLLIATGSLENLALTPSCNLPSLGVKDLSSSNKSISRNIRQTGYLYHNDLIKYLPPEIQKSVMRIISGKIILASRIDYSNSNPNGDMGVKFKKEIETKIDKLLAPPEHVPDKALAKPIEIKSKKRGGRKVRKFKQKFAMTDLAKAQNKIEFGLKDDKFYDGREFL
ncbi:PRP31 [Candida pseudojiufengensis]|uniref:PRP31 n=1 Tax=Candida pseudojiufengensis TaxID=497109 RepID=UPI002225280B|nr:PRP31 [Candida pseudojiufengensis]KAI5966177.1 PRP31 [Candida pseudojiufengensis]